MTRFEILRSDSVDVAIDLCGGVPAIVHWGPPLGGKSREPDFEAILDEVRVPGALDVSRRIEVVPMHADGFSGRPGLQGHRRGGRFWAPRFALLDTIRTEFDGGSTLVCRSLDSQAHLLLETRFMLDTDGVLVMRVTIENNGDSPYLLDSVSVSIPFPSHGVDLGTFTGRWVREFQFERFPWPRGAWSAENRSGRTSHEHPPFIWVLDSEASELHGEVWGMHIAWSGNHVVFAERLSDGRRYVQLGELFHPGEICIEPGESLSSPEIVCVHSSHGVTSASQMFHSYVRRTSPVRARKRLVHLNTWEAVYFDHDMDRLKALADAAASVGVERFILDDGWFGSRRDDSRGLGDWFVSPDVYPKGLDPLVEYVGAKGMDFGIWVEPEMANPDSELLKAHPDWVLATHGYDVVLGRNQVVLDLSRDEVFEYVFGRIDELLFDNAIAYVKWDMNRPLVQASTLEGKAASRLQTLAVYRLLDVLRSRHPAVEFESCASGGGRIDFAMLSRVERVWTSDSNDPLERQNIMRGASMVLPLEVLGSHIGPSPSHTTHRRHSLAFRGAAALFGHLGIEADLTVLDEREMSDVARIVEVYKQYRHLIHGGNFVRIDPIRSGDASASGTALVHGVIAGDRTEALFTFVQMYTESSLVPDPVRIPGLDPDALYTVSFVPLSKSQASGSPLGPSIVQPNWLTSALQGQPMKVSGRMLSTIGLARPVMWPESAIVVHLSCA